MSIQFTPGLTNSLFSTTIVLMMKKLASITAFLFTFFLFVPIVSAQVAKSGELVVLPKDEIIEENYFAAGETVTLAGTVNGDAYMAGGNVNVEGTVNGDLLAAGGVVNVRGTVLQDVRVIGGQVNITGTIGGNITVTGGSVIVSDNAEITGSLVAAGGSITILAPVGKSITAGAGQLTIANVVSGNVLAGVGELSLTPNSEIGGNLTYYSENNAELQSGATISGKVQHLQPPVTEKKTNEAAQAAKQAVNSLYVIWQLISLVSAFVIGTLLIMFVPTFTKRTVETINKRPGLTLGIGLLTIIITPVLVLFLLSTIIGIPLGIMLLFVYIALMYLAKIPVALYIGEKVLGYANLKKSSQLLSLLVGLIIYGLLHFIPVIGALVGVIVLLMGIGSWVITKRDFYHSLRTKNSV